MHASELIQKIRANTIEPGVWLLVGTDYFFQRTASDALRAWAIASGTSKDEIEVYRAPTIDTPALVQSIRAPSLFSTRRLVHIQQAEKLKAASLEQLESLLSSRIDGCVVVIQAEKLDGRNRFCRQAKKSGFWVDTAPLKGAALRQFVQSHAKHKGSPLALNTADLLIETCGADMVVIDDALERMSIFLGNGAQIDARTIEQCVTRLPHATIWELVDSVGAGQTKQALIAMQQLLLEGEPPLRILAMLSRQFRMLARVRSALDDGQTATEAARAASAPTFKAHDLAHSAQRLTQTKLQRFFKELARLERQLKRSRLPAEVLMQQTILSLTRA